MIVTLTSIYLFFIALLSATLENNNHKLEKVIQFKILTLSNIPIKFLFLGAGASW